MMADMRRVGVIGATSLVGHLLLPQLASVGYQITAFSRSDAVDGFIENIEWRKLESQSSKCQAQVADINISHWVLLAPVWCARDYFSMLMAFGARRIVALSSTSVFTKSESSDLREQETAGMLKDAEDALRSWAECNGIEWIILRPTLIYGLGVDKNISEIAGFIRRFGFFPLVGEAQGLRQPVHAADVAGACKDALLKDDIANRAYNVSGGETVVYREMVARIFAALGQEVRVVPIPLWVFRVGMLILRLIPRYRHWTASMAERMNRDMIFDHGDAARDFFYRPGSFALSAEDVTSSAGKQAER